MLWVGALGRLAAAPPSLGVDTGALLVWVGVDGWAEELPEDSAGAGADDWAGAGAEVDESALSLGFTQVDEPV
ncbi:MAG: hypothetical protein NVS3B12_17910 [Acidimicrobiales bacterium]